MSKYTRLNKINHYHDTNNRQDSQKWSPLLGFARETVRKTETTMPVRERTDRSCVGADEERDCLAKKEARRRALRISSSCNNSSSLAIHLMRKKKNTTKTMITKTKKQQQLAFYAIASSVLIIYYSLILLILLSNANEVLSLNCYHCSSVDNPECDEPFTGRANFTDTDCEKHIGRPAKVCRKIVQYIEHKKVVIRSCGYIDDHEEKDRKSMCHKRSGTFAIMMESCNCYTDLCNHSASLVPTQSVTTVSVLLATSSLLALYSYLTNFKFCINSGNKMT